MGTISLDTPNNKRKRHTFNGYSHIREQVRQASMLIERIVDFENETRLLRMIIVWHFRDGLSVDAIVHKIKDTVKPELWMSERSVRNVLTDAKKV